LLDLLVHRDQRDVADDLLVDRRFELGVREHDAFERVVVVDPGDVQLLVEVLHNPRRTIGEARLALPQLLHLAIEIEKLRFHKLSRFFLNQMLSLKNRSTSLPQQCTWVKRIQASRARLSELSPLVAQCNNMILYSIYCIVKT